jgi:glycosyltransferase involved in cell wall biosynthesis
MATPERLERIRIRNERIKARKEREKLADLKEEERLDIIKKEQEENPEPPEDPNKILTIEICIHCYNYQRRLCWMLSSILQQKGELPNIIVNISSSPNNGDPTTEEVCKFFREKGLNIIETEMTEKEACNRAIARNRQVAQTKADWILFADSDLVYNSDFFEDLQRQLKTNLKDEKRVMGADRHSLDIPFCIKYFEEDQRIYPCVIEDVDKITNEWPKRSISGRRIAAGYFQLASVKSIMTKGEGKYTGKEGDYWRATKSDRAFRCRMGGRLPINVKPQFHLNHDRGGPEIQR